MFFLHCSGYSRITNFPVFVEFITIGVLLKKIHKNRNSANITDMDEHEVSGNPINTCELGSVETASVHNKCSKPARVPAVKT